MTIDDGRLLLGLVLAVVLLIVLITKWRVAPYIAMLLASVLLALITGLGLQTASEAFAEGVGGLLASTALVIGFGAILGSLLAESGGAEVIAKRLAGLLGPQRLGWTMFLVGTLVGIGVWFTVGLVLLAPIAITLARVTRTNLLVPACAMLAGLSAMHGLAPPHPGPLAAIELLGADVGRTILWSLLVGIVAGAIAGPIYWVWMPRSLRPTHFASAPSEPSPAEPSEDAPLVPDLIGGEPLGTETDIEPSESSAPSLAVAVGVLLLPVVLMIIGSAAESLGTSLNADESVDTVRSSLRSGLVFLGDPTIAMLLGVLVAYALIGKQRGYTTTELSSITERSLYPVANVLLIVGAGAGFSRVLIASGVGDTIAELAQQLPLPPLVFGWLMAASVRVATGSATTAITTAAGLVAVLVQQDDTIHREWMVLAMGAGSLTLSHVNDGGFWFVKEYFGLTVQETLRTWTVLETVLSIAALLCLLILDALV